MGFLGKPESELLKRRLICVVHAPRVNSSQHLLGLRESRQAADFATDMLEISAPPSYCEQPLAAVRKRRHRKTAFVDQWLLSTQSLSGWGSPR